METSNREITVYLYEGAEKKNFERLLWKSLMDFAKHRGSNIPRGARIVREERKKPRLSPECGVYFSISHTKGIWACAVALEEVGLDIEKIRSCDRELIAKRFFHPAEAGLILKNPEIFFDIWTAKESYVKYTGVGIDDSFSDFSVAGEKGLLETVEGAALMPLDYREEYRMCVCARKMQGVTLRVHQ